MAPSAHATYHGDGYGDEWGQYDDSTFPLTPQRSNSSGYGKPAPLGAVMNDAASYSLSLNAKMRNHNQQDAVGKHLLYETAMMDSQTYEVMSLDEVEEAKKELARLKTRIESTQRKLALESKVRDAATNLQRLYSKDPTRADSPQNADSPKRQRRSLLGHQRSGSAASTDSKTLSQTEEELASSTRKVDELNDTIKTLLDRRQMVEGKLLRHTAAVLAEQKNQQQADQTANILADNDRAMNDDSSSIYSPDDFDGIRDILLGRPAHSIKKMQSSQQMQEEHEQQLRSMQARLEHLNDQLRGVISEASQTRGVSSTLEPEDESATAGDAASRLNSNFDRFEDNLRRLQQEHEETKRHYAEVQDSSDQTRNAVEQQLEGLNARLHNTLMQAPTTGLGLGIQEPPKASGHGYQPQLAYFEESLDNIEQLLRNGPASPDAQAKSQRLDEYEATVGGLWEIMQSEEALSRTPQMESGRFSVDTDSAPRSPALDSFSLPAFSSRVQHLFNRASSASQQHDILRRQIQQQRELNGKSDAEKDREIEDLQTRHQESLASYEGMQDELAKALAAQQTTERETNGLKAELLNVENELDNLRRTAELKTQEREEMARQLAEQREATGHLQQEIQELEAGAAGLEGQSAKLEAAESKLANAQREAERLEGEVVRLSTELTMARAELDGAYGSRAERAKEAQGNEIQVLRGELDAVRAESVRAAELEQELRAMTADFQELTHESLLGERERAQLDGTIDELREKVERLEGLLSDERVRTMGMKEGGEGGQQQQVPAREATSTMVMRQEFKKMMRETRAEGLRLLRVEQEERRKLESELRRLKAGTPIKDDGRLSVNGYRSRAASGVSGASSAR